MRVPYNLLSEFEKKNLSKDDQISTLRKRLAVATEALGIIKHYKSRHGDDVQSEIAANALREIEGKDK